jgi:hypothetical protein
LQSQVLKVGHHGSSYSTSQAFLNAINPTYGVISAGINNSYGHPAQQTLDRLANSNIITYGTYRDGTVIFQLNAASQTLIFTPSPSPTLTVPELSPLFILVAFGLIFFSTVALRKRIKINSRYTNN